MRRALSVELSRAFSSRAFLAALTIALGIVVVQIVMVPFQYGLGTIWTYWRTGVGGAYPPSLYSTWIGQTSYSVVTAIFYYLLPLLACIPYADSLCTDISSRFTVQAAVRSGRKAYIFSKSFAVALSSCAVVVVPLMINVLLTACLVPALVPEPAAGMFLAPNTMLADLYYESPLGYIALFLVLTGFLAGAYGLLSVVLSFWIHNRFVVLLLPFALCMALDFMLQGTFLAGFSPTNMVFPYQPYPSIFWVVLLLIFLLWCLLALVLWLKGRSYEDI